MGKGRVQEPESQSQSQFCLVLEKLCDFKKSLHSLNLGFFLLKLR